MKILLTAFDPFDGTGLNASQEGCRIFLDRWASAFDLRFVLLPTEYDRDVEALDRALAEGPVDALLHTGQAAGSAQVRVERMAVNVRHAALPDEVPPYERPDALIEPGGPAGLFSTLPVERIAEAIREAGVPAYVSNHAGIYLCNHILYRSLRRAGESAGPALAGFLHVPCLPEQVSDGRPSMAAEEIARAIRAAVACLYSLTGEK